MWGTVALLAETGCGVTDWKQELADEAEKALQHPFVVDAMQEFADNMRFKLDGLPSYGLHKVAGLAAQVARAQALGIDPDTLRLTPQEARELQMDLALRFALADKEVIFVGELEGEDES